jgi:hypothetical protein
MSNNKIEPTYHELKVDADGKQLTEAITVDIESLSNRVKSKVYQLRLTPFEHAKLLKAAKEDNCDLKDYFNPIITKLCKRK